MTTNEEQALRLAAVIFGEASSHTRLDLERRIVVSLAAAERRGLLRAAELMNKRADAYAAQGATVHWDIRAVAREVAELADSNE